MTALDRDTRAKCRRCGGPIGEPDGITGVGHWAHVTEIDCIEYLKAALIAEHEPVPDAEVAAQRDLLFESTIDYDNSQMPDGAEPRRFLTCGEIRQTADMLERLSREPARQSAATAKALEMLEIVCDEMAEETTIDTADWQETLRAILAQIDAPAPRADAGTDAHREDMANVGESLMDTLESNRQHPLLKHWYPADDPAEIVADLLNANDDKAAQLDALNKGVAAVQERIGHLKISEETSDHRWFNAGLSQAITAFNEAFPDQHLSPAAQPASAAQDGTEVDR